MNIRTVSFNDDGESSNETTEFENIVLNNVYLAGLKYLDEARNEPCNAIVVAVQGFALKGLRMENVVIGDGQLTDLSSVACLPEVSLQNVRCGE